MRKLKILVVGAGPVGLTLAKELRYFGLSPRIIDKNALGCKESRALGIWSRTLELLSLRGSADAFLKKGLKLHRMVTYTSNAPLLQVNFDALPTPYPFCLILPQSDTEAVLNTQLEEAGGKVEQEVELTSFEYTNKGANVVLLHHDTGKTETLFVDYLFGCDGAHSLIRHGINANFHGKQEGEAWGLADMTLEGELPRDQLSAFWSRDGILAFFPLPNGQTRIIVVRDPKQTGELTLEELQGYVNDRCPRRLILKKPTWISPFTINERVTDRYYDNGVVLLGDAAHVHSPAGGQGMNTGMQDAINLAWKIAAIQSGGKPDVLLASYTLERRQIGKEVVGNAARMTHIVTLKKSLLIRLRNVVLPRLIKQPKLLKALTETMAELNLCYRQSPLVIRPKQKPGYPGMRLMEGLVDGVSLFSQCRTTAHTLLFFGGSKALHDALLAMAPKGLNVIKIAESNLAVYEAYNIKHSRWLLIRPDHCIAARGRFKHPRALLEYFKAF